MPLYLSYVFLFLFFTLRNSFCNPCNDCYKQRAPLFDPKRSSTYKKVPCSSSQCQSLKGTSCSGSDD
ncbi:aspartic proteinase cdr1 [Quercus suber]|uniref:Aspartic proteinase cdr1 n=1 Tax=Quercus suber TaxID=58331 RepID=A0AAW0KF41_QUESU